MSDHNVLVVGISCLFVSIALGAGLWRTRSSISDATKSLAALDEITILRLPVTVSHARAGATMQPVSEVVRRLALRLSPASYAGRVQRLLDKAGNPPGWPLDRLFAAKGFGLLAAAGFGALLGAHKPATLVMYGLLGAASGFWLPDLVVYNTGLKRQETIQKTLPDALDLLTISVEAGLGFDAALSQVAHNTEGPIAGEFFRVLQEMQIGKSRTDALRGLGDRTTVADLRVFTSAIVQADGLGIPIAHVLREQAKEMRLKRHQRAEEKAQKVTVKIMFPLVMCILPSLFVVVIGPGAISIIHAFSHQ